MQINNLTGSMPSTWSELWQRWQQSGGAQRLPRWISLLLLLMLAYSLAQATWLLLAPVGQVSKLNSNGSTKSTRPASQTARLNSVSRLHLFGVASKVAAKPTNAPIEAPDTRLQLLLRGVMASNDPETAYAIISDGRKKSQVYRNGAALPGGAKLHAIYADRVILQRNGRLETLRLPVKRVEFSATAPRVTRTSSRNRRTPPKIDRSASAATRLKSLRESLIAEPQQIWDHARIEPALDGNRNIKGFKVFMKDKKLMREVGLRNGDVVVEVNGLPANDPTMLSQLFEQLKSAESVNLTVERNGELVNLTL